MNSYFAQRQHDKAIAAANAQIAKSPKVANFYDLLGTALFNGKKDCPAPKPLSRSHRTRQDPIRRHRKARQSASAGGRRRTRLSLSTSSPSKTIRERCSFYVLSGELYEARKDYDHAKGMYQQALSISPDQPLASNDLAFVILEQGGDIDVAMGLAQTARRGMPDSPDAADTLGWAYYPKGIYQSAINQFQEACVSGPPRTATPTTQTSTTTSACL